MRSLVQTVLNQGKDAIEPDSLLNVNVPGGEVKGYRITSMGKRLYRDQVDVRKDLRGRPYYWIGGPEVKAKDDPDSDSAAVRAGMASITPILLDLTHRSAAPRLASWKLGDFSPGTAVSVGK
jgi:5'-nucleotidase